MTKEQARVFVKAEKNKMTPAQIHENSRQIIVCRTIRIIGVEIA